MESIVCSTPPPRRRRTPTPAPGAPARNPLRVTRLRHSVPRAMAAYAEAAAAIEAAAAAGAQAEAALQ